MKFFSIVLLLLLVFDGLKGLTLPQERPDKGLNTTLLANFSGLYVRRNPCSNEQMEASSYEASHEFHHHTKGSNWTEYTNKCSLLISNFLKSISNLIKFNNKHDGTFTFHVNTSITQKQADQRNCKGQRYSLPTIVIEATNCANPEQSKKPEDKGLTEEGPKRKVLNGLFGKQKRRRDPEKAYGELSSISQGSSEFSSTIKEETGADRPFTEISEEPLTIFETTQIAVTENYPQKNTNADNLKRRQEWGNASGEISNEYVTETPWTTPVNSEKAKMSQTDSIDGLILGSTEKPNLGVGNQFRNSKFKIKPTRPFETTTNRGLLSPDSQQQSFNGVRKEALDFISPTSSVTQQPRNPLHNRGSQFFLTTVSPVTKSEKIETIEEITEYDSEQPENLNADNLQTGSFNSNINPNVYPVQSAESSDYLEKEDEFNIPNIPNSATGLPEYLPATVRFDQEKFTAESPPEKRQSQILQQSDILPNTPLTSEGSSGISSIGLGLQTPLDAAQPQPKNLFGERLRSTESLIKPNQKAQLGITTRGSFLPSVAQYEEEIINQFQSSEQSDQTYVRNSEAVVDNNQNFSEAPGYANMETSPSREVLQPETILNEGSAQPLDYLPTTRKPMPTDYDEKTTENLNFKPGRQVADQIKNFSEKPKSFNRPPVTEPTTDAVPVTYSPQRKSVSSLEKEILTTESSLRKVSQVKPNFFPSQTPNYGSPAPPQENPFVPESSIASDIVKYDYSDSLSSASSTTLPEQTVSVSEGKIIKEPVTDYYDTPVEQSPDDVTDPDPPLNDFLEDSPTSPYSRSKSETTTTVYESDTQSYSQQNQQSVAPSAGIYEPHTISAPRPVELNIPVEQFQSNAKRLLPSENYSPYGTNNGKNIGSYSTNYPTTVLPEPQSETELDNVNLDPTNFSANQLPVGPLPSTFSHQNLFSEDVVKTTEEINSSAESEQFSISSLDHQTPSSLPKFQQPLGTSTNLQQFPVIIQPQSRKSEEFSETTLDSSQQTSSFTAPASGSQEAASSVAQDDQRNSLLTVTSESENASASDESYYLNQDEADTFSEQRQYDDTETFQDARTQIPQPQPSLDYPDQLLSNEQESNIDSADLQTSKTFEGSEPNFQPLLTYSPSPSIPSKTQTFTTEAYESDEVADEYPLPSQLQPEAIGSTALEMADTSSSSSSQLSSVQNIETVDTTELPRDYSAPTYNRQFIPITPPPFLTAAEEPPFVKKDLPAYETYSVPEAFVQDIPTTPLPQSMNAAKYDREIIATDNQSSPSPSPAAFLPANYPDQLLNNKKKQGFLGGNLAVTEQLEDRLERSDIKATTSQLVFKNSNGGLRDERVIQKSNSNQDIIASSTALIEEKYDASSQQLQSQSVTLPLLNKGIDNLPKTGAYPNNLGLASSAIGPVHTKTTFDEEVITTDNPNSLSLSPTQAPPVGYSLRPDEQFEGRRRNFPSSTTPQASRQFYLGNRPIYHPPQGFPPQHQFENRPYGNYPQPVDFNPQAPGPRLGQFDNFAREQRNQFPTSFQNNQFESRFPVSSRFQPGLDPQKDRFTFPGQPSNYGNMYLPPNGRPNFSYGPSSRSGVNPESLSPPSQVPPNFFSLQRPNAFEERDSQYQSYQGENFNTQLTAAPHAQNYEPYSHYPRDDFSERFGPKYPSFGPESRDRFHPDQIPYSQMMPPFRNHPAGYFNPHGPPFLNNSNQQVDDRYQQHIFDHRVDTIKGAKIQETEKIDINQASPEVLADYKKALTELPSGDRLVKFDEEVITISPQKETSSEATVVTEKQGQDAASYNFRNQGSGLMPITGPMGVLPQQAQQGNLVFRGQNRPLDFPLPTSLSLQSHPLPFSQSADSFGQRQPPSLPNFSNQFRSASSDFQQQSNANFANPQKPNGGNEVGPNPSQSDSYALGPDQISPPRKPDPASSRRSDVPSPYRNPVARPIAGPETFSSG